MEKNTNIYLDRLWFLIKELFTKIASVVGGILFMIFIWALAVLWAFGIPIAFAFTIIEWIVVPVPYFVCTGLKYYDDHKSLISKYLELVDKF